jgi:hypothetical protein
MQQQNQNAPRPIHPKVQALLAAAKPWTPGTMDPKIAQILEGSEEWGPPVPDVIAGNFRPRIVSPGDGRLVNEVAAEYGRELAKTQEIFVRDGTVLVLDKSKRGLFAINEARFVTWIERHVVPQRFVGGGDNGRLVNCSIAKSLAELILNSEAFKAELSEVKRVNRVRLPAWNFYDPKLKRRPRPNGDILSLLEPGYDAETQTYTFEDVTFDPDLDIFNALKILDGWLYDVAIDPSDRLRSVAVIHAMLLTPFCDLLISDFSLRPVFLVVGNCEGCGKTLLVYLALAPVFGDPTPTIYPGHDKIAEVLNSVARAGLPYLFLDNLKGDIGGSALEAFVTSRRLGGRILGQKDVFDVENRSLIYLTGNNLTLSPDMRRRVQPVNLFVEDARPELRAIKRRIDLADILKGRAEILAALWSIVRYWAYGADFHQGDENASFWAWGRTIGGIVQCIMSDNQSPLAAPVQTNDERLATWEAFQSYVATDRKDLLNTELKFNELLQLARESELFVFLSEKGDDVSPEARRREDSTLSKRFCQHFRNRRFHLSAGDVWFLDNGERGRSKRYTISTQAQLTPCEP